jgi:hypothetical protein
VDAAVKDAIAIHKSLVTLTPANHLKLVKVYTAAYKVDPSKLKGWCLFVYLFVCLFVLILLLLKLLKIMHVLNFRSDVQGD